MNLYEVTTAETTYETYQVPATSPEEAHAKLVLGFGDCIERDGSTVTCARGTLGCALEHEYCSYSSGGNDDREVISVLPILTTQQARGTFDSTSTPPVLKED